MRALDRGLEALAPTARHRVGDSAEAPGLSAEGGAIQWLPIGFTILATGFIFFATLGLRRLT